MPKPQPRSSFAVLVREEPGVELEGARMLPLDLLIVNQLFQRKVWGDIEELAKSIQDQGQLQPLVVRPIADGRYEIIAGNRRFHALHHAGKTEAQVIIREMSDTEAAINTAVENFQRHDLNLEEEARMYDFLIEQLHIDPDRGASQHLGDLLHRDHNRIWRVRRVAAYPDLWEQVVAGTMTLTAALGEITIRIENAKPRPALLQTSETSHGEKFTNPDNSGINLLEGEFNEQGLDGMGMPVPAVNPDYNPFPEPPRRDYRDRLINGPSIAPPRPEPKEIKRVLHALSTELDESYETTIKEPLEGALAVACMSRSAILHKVPHDQFLDFIELITTVSESLTRLRNNLEAD